MKEVQEFIAPRGLEDIAGWDKSTCLKTRNFLKNLGLEHNPEFKALFEHFDFERHFGKRVKIRTASMPVAGLQKQLAGILGLKFESLNSVRDRIAVGQELEFQKNLQEGKGRVFANNQDHNTPSAKTQDHSGDEAALEQKSVSQLERLILSAAATIEKKRKSCISPPATPIALDFGSPSANSTSNKRARIGNWPLFVATFSDH